MSRTEMQDMLIETLGFEHPDVVEFFQVCEELPDNKINNKSLEKVACEILKEKR